MSLPIYLPSDKCEHGKDGEKCRLCWLSNLIDGTPLSSNWIDALPPSSDQIDNKSDVWLRWEPVNPKMGGYRPRFIKHILYVFETDLSNLPKKQVPIEESCAPDMAMKSVETSISDRHTFKRRRSLISKKFILPGKRCIHGLFVPVWHCSPCAANEKKRVAEEAEKAAEKVEKAVERKAAQKKRKTELLKSVSGPH